MANAAPKEAARESQDQTSTTPTDDRKVMYYRAEREGGHITERGKVALGNWSGKVSGQTHRVYFGAPIGKVPAAVREAMTKSRIGVQFGEVTQHDLMAKTWDRSLRRGVPVAPSPPNPPTVAFEDV